MSNLNISVDIFGGSSIDAACNDLVALAKKLGIVVLATFNGVRLMAHPDAYNSSGAQLHASYNRAIKSKMSHPYASSKEALSYGQTEQA